MLTDSLPPVTTVPRACTICGDALVPKQNGHGRCWPCYMYHYRTGRDRPAYLFDPRVRRRCANCGEPLRAKSRGRGAGLCGPCFQYVRRTGRPRGVTVRERQVARQNALLRARVRTLQQRSA